MVYNWPLDVTADELAYDFVRPIAWFSDQSTPRASAEIIQVCEVLVARIQQLRNFLSGGILVARGTHAATGNVLIVDSFQWKRKGTLLDVQNSDLSDGQQHAPTLGWTGLSLEAGPSSRADESSSSITSRDTAFHGKLTEDDNLRSATIPSRAGALAKPRRSAWKASIEAAVRALWPDGIPATLPLKSRDDQIAAWQKKKEFPVASSKTIRRYLTDDGHFRR